MEMNWAITCVCLFFETKSLLVIHAWKVYECFLRSSMWCSQLSRAPHSLEKLDTDYRFKFLNTWISQFNEGNIQSVHEINQILKSPISKPYLEDNNRHRFGLKIDLTQGMSFNNASNALVERRTALAGKNEQCLYIEYPAWTTKNNFLSLSL